MLDEEVLDIFLKENAAELRRDKRRAMMRAFPRWIKPAAIAFVATLIVICVFLYAKQRIAVYYVEKDAEEELNKEIADTHLKAKQAAENAAIAVRKHQEDQYAFITVQYNELGNAVGCWITHNKNDIAVFNASTPVAYSYISNWKDYTAYSSVLRVDPKICFVLDWEGKDK